MSGGGVYVYWALKPGARFNIPILSRHCAYVGETTSFRHRHEQHTRGDTVRSTPQKPWADLDPRCVLRIPLPAWKPLLRSVETVLIVCTWPVYNHRKNLWNPRRIPLHEALRQRQVRDRGGHPLNIRTAHVFVALALLVAAVALVGARW